MPPPRPAVPRLAALALALACAMPAARAADASALAAERALGTASAAIGAGAAHARGLTGAGVAIAVLDTGIDAAHPEFAGRLLRGFDALGGGADTADRNGHGTHVAGLIGAARDGRGLAGVAYDARLMPVRILDASGTGTAAQLDAGLRHAARAGVPIANLSVGSAAATGTAALREAVGAGVLLVVAAGNRGAAHPDWPARHASADWARGRIIAVGAIEADGTIAPWSNRAGDARDAFLVAPGAGLVSTRGDGYAAMSGTSMAAPIVSGAAALLKQAWPWLRAEELAGILLATATDLGAPGPDAIYGRGRVDVGRALQPVGALAVRAPDGTRLAASAGTLRASSATVAVAAAAAQGAFRMAALDDFSRDFQVDLGAAVVRQPSPMSLERVFGRVGEQLSFAEGALAGGARLALVSAAPLPGVAPADATPFASPLPFAAAMPGAPRAVAAAVHGASLTGSVGAIDVAAATGALSGRGFGLQAMTVAGTPLAGLPGLASPYLALAGGGVQLAGGVATPDVQVRVGLLNASGPTGTTAGLVDPARAQATVVEVSRAIGASRLAATWSATRESDALLGARASGALALAGGLTQALEVSGAVPLAPRTALVGTLGVGGTRGTGFAALDGAADVRTRAFALALVEADAVVRGDRLVLSVSQPMRASGGTLSMRAPVGAEADGTMRYETRRVAMAPSGRELIGEASWLVPAGRERTVGLTLGLRRQADHDAGAGTAALAAIRFSGTF